jgi:hypothetical protein
VRDSSVDPKTIDDDITVEGYGFGHLQKEGYRIVGPTEAELPVGIDIMSRPFGEPVMLRIAAEYEAGATYDDILMSIESIALCCSSCNAMQCNAMCTLHCACATIQT